MYHRNAMHHSKTGEKEKNEATLKSLFFRSWSAPLRSYQGIPHPMSSTKKRGESFLRVCQKHRPRSSDRSDFHKKLIDVRNPAKWRTTFHTPQKEKAHMGAFCITQL